jgi:2-oxo-3-hexenedioate decarboxylase
MPLSTTATETAASAILAALDERRQITPLTDQAGGLSLPDAYRISRAVTARRVARGETPVGRKIGFTNRMIWDEYGVHHPIDGPVYDTTLTFVQGAMQSVSLAPFLEPRIEPEIVLGLSATPTADMDERALMGCIGWMAHGFEIVQSLFPAWRFSGADCVGAFGLHGALLCGPKHVIQPSDRPRALQALTAFTIELSRDGAAIDTGHAANVLGGPVSALRHLVQAIASDPEAAPLLPGDVITTGTVTRAFPVMAGECWTTRVTGIALPGMDVSFCA